MKKIAILGAGISGLTIAWYLKQKYAHTCEIALFEKSDRVGGKIESFQQEGFHFERGPRGFVPYGRGEATLRLVEALGLASELIPSDPLSRARFIGYENRLHPFSIGYLIKQGGLGALLKDLWTPRSSLEDESVDQFMRRRFNGHIADFVFDPLIKGIFGGDSKDISMRSGLPLLWNYERESRSLVIGALKSLYLHRRRKKMAALYSFKGGMERLIKQLADQLNLPIFLNYPIQNWDDVKADVIISTLPLSSLAPLIPYQIMPDAITLSQVHCGWNRDILKTKGYGFLLPSKEKGDILGMIWESMLFPQLNQGSQTRLTAMISGEHPEKVLYEKARCALHRYLDIDQLPDFFSVTVSRQAIPQYLPFHHEMIKKIRETLPPHTYALGNSFDGIGLNDVIALGEAFANGLSF